MTTYTTKLFVRDLAAYIKPYKRKFIIGVIIRLTSDIARLYPAYALSQIIPLLNQIHEPAALHKITIQLILWYITVLYISFSHDFSKYLGYQVAESASLDLYKKCLGHIFKLDLSWQELEGSGNKMKRIDRGHDGINESIRRIFDVLIEVLVNTVGIVFIFFSLDKTLSIAIVFFIITFFLLGKHLIRKAKAQEQIVNAKFENLTGITFESLNNILTIKSMSFNNGIMHIISKQIKTLMEEIRKRIFLYRLQSGTLNLYHRLFEVITVSFIIWGIYHNYYSLSILILFVGLFEKVGQSTAELIHVTQQMVVNKIWVSRATDILSLTPTIENPAKETAQLPYPSDWKTLRVSNIHFSYKEKQTLTNISFDIKRGESTGIVGLSGAGKSTLFKLLLDLYEDYQGEIYLDQTPLKQINRQSYINHLSIVLQDTELFNMTLAENITIANPAHSNKKELEEVIQMAHLEDVVKNLPNGINTLVGEKGIKLSGGQRQRVGIARALYRQPDILLLDEATSHLDTYSENQIKQAISEIKGKFTTVIIAHRLSTIQEMDKIIVLEQGILKETGTFQELLNKNGPFSRMWKIQKL